MKILQGEIGFDLLLTDFEGVKSVMINSPGGSLFEGLAMYDFVKSSDIEVGIIGLSASAATLPLIASGKRWGTPNSRYLIHNPWSMAIGDAESVAKTAKELKAEQDRALQLYVQHLNGTAEELQALMNEERILDAKEALELGLINEIREYNTGSQEEPEGSDVKNIYNKFKMSFKMKDEQKEELSGFGKKLDQILNFLSPAPKMLVVQDVNGTEIDFGDAVETEEQIAVGANATVDGAPASGDYVVASGETYVFDGGELTEIKPASEEEESNEEMEAVQEENTQLKNDAVELNETIQNLTKERDDFKMKLDKVGEEATQLKADFVAFKGKFSTEKPEVKSPKGEEKKEQKNKFSYKKNK